MNIHEYQAKQLLREYGAPVSDGRVVLKADEAKTAAGEIDGPIWVVKAQIHAGGRGKGKFKEADGRRKGRRPRDHVGRARPRKRPRRCSAARSSPSRPAPPGKQVNRIYIEDGSDIARELYLALLIDRVTSRIAFVCSTEGGMDIEEVAHNTPEKILTFSVDPASGISGFHGRRVAFALGLEGKQVKQCVDLVDKLYRLFIEKDCEMLEINPLIVTDRRRPQVPRRQDELRRQRALPPHGHRRPARRDRGRPQGTRRLEVRPQLHRARRQHRLHGQRRRPRDGDDGHHQALRRASRPTSSTSAAAPPRRR